MEDYDVIVVGASVAGCTTATLMGRRGLKVALIERHRRPSTHKVLCTHFIHASATPVVRRLGLDELIEAAGGIPNELDVWTPWGWVTPPPGEPAGYNLRRERLDPMLRQLAAETPGVDLLTGQRVVDLVASGKGVAGVRVRGGDGREHLLRSRLVVGADGARSSVAQLAGARERVKPNRRSFHFAYFTGVSLSSGHRSQTWLRNPDVAYAFPNDDGLTLLAYFPAPDSGAFTSDRQTTLTAAFGALPDGPALDGAQQVSKVISASDYPIMVRPAVPAPGLALVGDAALTSDPTFGVGCEWAFRGAEWLADAVTEPLVDGGRLGPALRRYRRCRRALRGHQTFIEFNARGRPFTPLDRLLLSAAVRDPAAAAELVAFFHGRLPLHRFASPTAIARAIRTRRRAAPQVTSATSERQAPSRPLP